MGCLSTDLYADRDTDDNADSDGDSDGDTDRDTNVDPDDHTHAHRNTDGDACPWFVVRRSDNGNLRRYGSDAIRSVRCDGDVLFA